MSHAEEQVWTQWHYRAMQQFLLHMRTQMLEMGGGLMCMLQEM